MKKILVILIILVTTLFFVPVIYADSCEDVTHISFSPFETDEVLQINKIINALSNPQNYYSILNDRYELCFDVGSFLVRNDIVQLIENFNGSFTLSMPSNIEHAVYVKGLNLIKDSDLVLDSALLTVNNASVHNVILDELELSNVKDGLKVEGGGVVEVSGSTITGDVQNQGLCLQLSSDNAVVKNSNISSCAEGVRIEGNNNLLGALEVANYEAEKNTIKENGIGIHVVSGSGNKFGLNDVFDNPLGGEIVSADNGITIDIGANGDVPRPEVIVDEATQKALVCERGENGNIEKRYLKFANYTSGSLYVFKSDEFYKQSEKLLWSCAISESGECIITNWSEIEVVGATECGVDNFYVTAIFTNENSSMYSAEPFALDGVFSVPAPPIELPTTVGISNAPEDTTVTGADGGTGGVSAVAGMSPKCTLTQSTKSSVPDTTVVLIMLTFVLSLILFHRKTPRCRTKH